MWLQRERYEATHLEASQLVGFMFINMRDDYLISYRDYPMPTLFHIVFA